MSSAIVIAVGASVAGAAVSNAMAPSPSSGSPSSQPGGPSATADPFASQRPQYQTQLNSLMNGNFSPSDPSYKWRMDQGIDATNRGMAATGQIGSGAQMAELDKYGQGMASQEYSNQFSRLSQLAGANIGSPAAAAQLQQAQQNQQQGAATSVGGTIGNAVGTGLTNWLSPSPTNNTTGTGFDTGVGGSGYSSSSMGYDQSSMLSSQWSG